MPFCLPPSLLSFCLKKLYVFLSKKFCGFKKKRYICTRKCETAHP